MTTYRVLAVSMDELKVGDVVLRRVNGSYIGRVVDAEGRMLSFAERSGGVGPRWELWIKVKPTHKTKGRNKNKARWGKASSWRRISPLEQLACCADEIDKLPTTQNESPR